MAQSILISGEYGEGGGQIIRTALSLAAITGRAVEISNIRSKRSKPGLQPQHLTAVHAAAAICNAEVAGAAVGSAWLRFAPQTAPQPGNYRWEIGTAGATTLVAQTVLLPLALADAPSRVTITGGTHVPHAPVAEYLEGVYLPMLRHAGCAVKMEIARTGFYPRGGGEITLHIAGGYRAPPHHPCRARRAPRADRRHHHGRATGACRRARRRDGGVNDSQHRAANHHRAAGTALL